LKINRKVIKDEKFFEGVVFKRPTNFYGFDMLQKLIDPGLNYEHLSEKTIGNKAYDIVKITFNSENDKPTDIYQLYIKKSTSLVDQFLLPLQISGRSTLRV
jgi:hypothetical protein